MVQGKKPGDQTNGTAKAKDQSSNMFQRNSTSGSRGGSEVRADGRVQNGNAGGFRTDSAISGNKTQGERVLQRWVPDNPAGIDGSLESSGSKSGQKWDQFAENERRFGVTTDYDENIYTTTIDKNHPKYKQRLAEADRKAREIERSAAMNSHVAEERVTDNLNADSGDEEDKYSGVRRQDFPPLSSSNNKYTPPARRAPTGQATVSGAPVDPAIISISSGPPDKANVEKSKATPVAAPAAASKASKEEAEAPAPAAAAPSTTPAEKKEVKAALTATPSSSSTVRKASPQTRPDGINATDTVEKDVIRDFRNFANQQRKNVDMARQTRARNDKEVKLNDLKKFANSFKLHTPVPSDLVPIIAKDPAKQKEIQEKARRNIEEAKSNQIETAKPIAPAAEPKPVPRPAPASHGTSPAANTTRQNGPRNQGYVNQNQYNSQSYRNDRSSQQQIPTQQNRQPGGLGARLRSLEQNKTSQLPLHPVPGQDGRLPPTGPSNNSDPNYSRRSSGVISAQGRLNPNSSEFRPSPHAATFNPNGNASTAASSPRSNITAVAPTPAPRSLLKRQPIPASERPLIAEKFNALEYVKTTFLPDPKKDWSSTGGLKPAYDTPPVWRVAVEADKPDSTIHLTYTKLFEMTPYPAQTLSPPHPSHVAPQVPHQHQLPFHLQQNNMGPRQSPRQPQMHMGNQHGPGPNLPFNADEHRMMPSHSAQSFASPRMQSNVPMGYPSPMNQNAQLFNPAMGGPYGAPMAMRSLSQTQQFPPQGHMMPQIMMPNPNPGFMTAQGMGPGPQQFMFPPNGQGQFGPPNGHPPPMPPNGYPSPGRGAPMMMSQGSQQGHQQQQMFMTPGMSPAPQFAAPLYPQQGPGQIPMRGGYGGPQQFGTSPQQIHQYGNQNRNNHQNGNFNNKNFQQHGQHPNGPSNNQIPTGPQARNAEGGEESK